MRLFSLRQASPPREHHGHVCESNMCVFLCAHASVGACTAHTYANIFICVRACVRACVHATCGFCDALTSTRALCVHACVRVYICVYIYACMHAYANNMKCAHLHVFKKGFFYSLHRASPPREHHGHVCESNMCVCLCAHACVRVCTAHTYAHIYACVRVCVCVRVRRVFLLIVCACVRVFMCTRVFAQIANQSHPVDTPTITESR